MAAGVGLICITFGTGSGLKKAMLIMSHVFTWFMDGAYMLILLACDFSEFLINFYALRPLCFSACQ